MCAVYAFARRVDDIGDGDLDASARLAELGRERDRCRGARARAQVDPGDPVMMALADACERFTSRRTRSSC